MQVFFETQVEVETGTKMGYDGSWETTDDLLREIEVTVDVWEDPNGYYCSEMLIHTLDELPEVELSDISHFLRADYEERAIQMYREQVTEIKASKVRREKMHAAFDRHERSLGLKAAV